MRIGKTCTETFQAVSIVTLSCIFRITEGYLDTNLPLADLLRMKDETLHTLPDDPAERDFNNKVGRREVLFLHKKQEKKQAINGKVVISNTYTRQQNG